MRSAIDSEAERHIKTLETENISAREHYLGNRYLNKHLHAERDVEARLRHFDGAMKAYPGERYEGRLAVHLTHGEPCRKIKLFRVDGDVDIERWLDMVGYFFSGNEMVLELFDPDLYLQYFDEKIAVFRGPCPQGTGRTMTVEPRNGVLVPCPEPSF